MTFYNDEPNSVTGQVEKRVKRKLLPMFSTWNWWYNCKKGNCQQGVCFIIWQRAGESFLAKRNQLVADILNS